MSEKRFRITTLPKSNAVAFDEKQKKYYIGIDFENLLNDQQATINKLKEENEQLKNKLNVTALELVDEAISMGKAVEISEMDYHEFLEYRQKKGKAMELQR